MRYLLMKTSVLRYLLFENRYLLRNFGTPLQQSVSFKFYYILLDGLKMPISGALKLKTVNLVSQ